MTRMWLNFAKRSFTRLSKMTLIKKIIYFLLSALGCLEFWTLKFSPNTVEFWSSNWMTLPKETVLKGEKKCWLSNRSWMDYWSMARPKNCQGVFSTCWQRSTWWQTIAFWGKLPLREFAKCCSQQSCAIRVPPKKSKQFWPILWFSSLKESTRRKIHWLGPF